jgi:hypothetical protein
MNERTLVIEDVCYDGDQAIDLGPSIVEIFEEHGYVVIGVRVGVAASAGAEQDHALGAIAVKRIQSRSKAG